MGEVPVFLRAAVAHQLSSLVAGDRPELMEWVRNYERGGALIDQPDDIWTSEQTSVVRRADGGWSVDLPLWTDSESPSDLTAHVSISADLSVEIEDVHVL